MDLWDYGDSIRYIFSILESPSDPTAVQDDLGEYYLPTLVIYGGLLTPPTQLLRPLQWPYAPNGEILSMASVMLRMEPELQANGVVPVKAFCGSTIGNQKFWNAVYSENSRAVIVPSGKAEIWFTQ